MSEGAGYVSSTKQAPELLDLVQHFVNTRNRMRDYDLLGDTVKASQWLYEAGYRIDAEIGDKELKRLWALREDLRGILAAHNLGASEQTKFSAARLNELCASVTLQPSFDSEGRPRLAAASGGAERLIGELLAATVRAQYTGVWKRLKACANADCRWIFYDHSKNRSGSWCVMDICGSRAKMRAYRKRQSS